MAFLHAHSMNASKSEMDLFSVLPTQTTIIGGQSSNYKPLASLTDQGPIEFVVPGHGDDYMDLAHTLLHLKVCITKLDGAPLDDKSDVGPVNNWLHSLFSQVDVHLNQKLISPPSNTYPYRAYIETLLNYGPTAKKSHLTSALWYKDEAGKHDDIVSNSGYRRRKEFTKLSKQVDLLGGLNCDIFNMGRFLLNEVELRVKMVRSRDTFSLMGDAEKYKVRISDATLIVRKVRINHTALLMQEATLNKTTAKYPMTRVETKVITISSNVQSKSLDNIFLGQMPKRVITGFISNAAYNGDITKSPFNFQNYGLQYLSLHLNGEQIPSRPLEPNFTSDLYVQSYYTLFSGTGIHYQDDGNDISREEYRNGFCLHAFDLTPDLGASAGTHWNVVRQGNLSIEVMFAQPLSEAVNCIIYAEFDSLLQINKQRNITVDFNG